MTAPPAQFVDVSCVVVHHDNFPGVLSTLDSLRDAGVRFDRTVLVDNSEDPKTRRAVRIAVESLVHYLEVENLGYANAVNRGIAYLDGRGLLQPFLLISTHEVVVHRDAVGHMRGALASDPFCAVAGPTLVDASRADQRIWSQGGVLSPVLRMPQHVGWGSTVAITSGDSAPVDRDWLDGSFCLYRTSALTELAPLDERFFLYFEETDCHARIRRAGHRVVWVPQALASQSTTGVPSYYLGRNTVLFQRANGTALSKVIAPFVVLAKVIAKRIASRSSAESATEVVAGMVDGYRHSRDKSR
ncbi:glycosyltransferase family 2 protein [Agromyces sp. NPDC004153]